VAQSTILFPQLIVIYVIRKINIVLNPKVYNRHKNTILSDTYPDGCLLGCYAVEPCRSLPTFQRSMLHPRGL
jgi:hypothetical protein